MIFEKLGIYGWKEEDENLFLANLLTGDPLLLIGMHGTAKTHTARKVSETIGRKFIAYDASKALFEDVLGYPNIEELKKGRVNYIQSNVTIWDKEVVLIDEINRALPEMQNKWLEIIRSRKIMGFETKVKWVFAAMNPLSYSGTQALDEALIGRFATFIYPPEALQMEESDRIKVTNLISGDDAPALCEWNGKVKDSAAVKNGQRDIGKRIELILERASSHFEALRRNLPAISEFLARFAELLMKETKGEITLDGRRLGFIYRNILALRAVELSKCEIDKKEVSKFSSTARYAVQSSIPVGLNEGAINMEETYHKMEICFDLLSSYFDKGGKIEMVNLIYELFTTKNILRKAEILLKENIGKMAQMKAWNDLMNGGQDISILAYTVLQVEARKPGIIPGELLESLSGKINGESLKTDCISDIRGESIEYVDEVENLLNRKNELELMIAINRVKELVDKGKITPVDIKEAKENIEQDISLFEKLFE